MKAIRVYEFGGPEVLQMVDVERPTPAANEVLIRMYATSVNPADYIFRQGGNDAIRPYLKLPLGLGLDAAGVVEQAGSEVTQLKPGDRVYGVPNFPGDGSYAEYIVAKASQFSIMPNHLTFNEAGALPSCALIAWNGIVDMGHVQPGQRVLIHGAAGGVGSLAVQFAHAKGAYVIGTASAYNFDFLKELGANEVIDYNTQHFEDVLQDVDLIFNASPVRDKSLRLKSVQVMRKGSVFVCTHLDEPFEQEFIDALAEKGTTATMVGSGSVTTYTSSLDGTTQLINESKVKAVINKVYPLAKVAEAHRQSETKHVSGKIVLEIRKEEE